MEKEIIAEISLEEDRLYLIHKRKGRTTSKTDVTACWHFFKEMQAYFKEQPHSLLSAPLPH